ncbi:MAG: response regulator [Myxococcota bacterium]
MAAVVSAPLDVLIVDDERDVVAMAELALTRLGKMRVVSAGSLAEARAALAASRPNIILADRGLPDGDGALWLEELRAKPDFESVVLFLFSANPKAGTSLPRLNKPFDPLTLAQELKDAWNSSQR